VSHRVIADHLRATSFLIADGVLPSNEGRGYVLRRIMRRAMRHVELLGVKEPLMWRLVPALVREMGGAYPELGRAKAMIVETLRLEESRFRRTLDRGLRILDEETARLGAGDRLAGEVAFKLYDTYGFPLDLTQDALKPRGVGVDTQGFNAAMERQREEARRAWAGSGEATTEAVWYDVKEKVGATEFLGYETETAEGVVRAIIAADGKETTSLGQGSEGAVIVNQTPFYGESGGQVGDEGWIRTADGASLRVRDTQRRLGDLYVHYGVVESGVLHAGDEVELAVDSARRQAIRVHHSATHLLHEALRQVLGPHVAQKGSLVAPDRLRFDFSHHKAMSPDEVARIEDIANTVVWQNDEVSTRLMSVDDAIAEGATALFGEKYGDEVRVVAMGHQPDGGNRPVYSMELCGGTHVRRTGDIGLIKIVSEGATAAGVRRIEALAGRAAFGQLRLQDVRVASLAQRLKVVPGDVEARVEALTEERRRLERELAEAKKKLAMGGGGAEAGDDGIAEVAGIKLMSRVLHGVEPRDLRGIADEGKRQVGSGIAAIVAVSEDGKAAVAVGVTDDLTDRFNAVELVRAGSQALGGKGGGGRPDMAQAGGPDGARAQEALDAISRAIEAA
jgi:alanyl-tRNA synthetase